MSEELEQMAPGAAPGQPATNEPLHPLLARRWSPTMFDESYEARTAEVESLLEAARWAPSAGNSQPWAFITARRGDAVHTRLLRHLAASSARWAPTASILVVNLCHRYVEDTDWDFSEFSLYDLGQAVAHMTIQAQSLGLVRTTVPGLRPGGHRGRVRRAQALAGHLDVRLRTPTGGRRDAAADHH